MKPVHFITGLPRSRTLWLAHYLCQQGVSTVHEPFAEGMALERLPELLERMQGTHAGASGAELAVLYSQLKTMFPEAKWMVVRRPLRHVENSFKGLGIPVRRADLLKMQEAVDAVIAAEAGAAFVVDFSKLSRFDNMARVYPELRDAGEFIKADWQQDVLLTRQAVGSNIQLSGDAWVQRMEAGKNGPVVKLLGKFFNLTETL